MLAQVEIERVVDVLFEVPGQVAVLVAQRPYVHLQNVHQRLCLSHDALHVSALRDTVMSVKQLPHLP